MVTNLMEPMIWIVGMDLAYMRGKMVAYMKENSIMINDRVVGTLSSICFSVAV